ncbi:MAG: SPOR domain-containing protein [Thermodesulfobacteriota bacterium]
MRSRDMLAFVALFVLVWMIGCSSEDPPPPTQDPEVVKRSIEPLSKSASVDVRTEEQEKPAANMTKPVASGVTALRESAIGALGGGGTDSRIELTGLETPSRLLPGTKYEKADPVPLPDEGEYIALPGDSLAVIAGRKDVFGDPLKWIVLYQLNRGKLEGLVLDERLPERPVPEGTRLRYSLTEEETRRVEAASDRTWVVNVVSSITADRIDGPAVQLLEKGYPVYISRATVDAQKWMRLRVGFFNDRESAVKEGEKLQGVLQQDDSWPVRIGQEEIAEYADLLRPLYEG